MTRRCFVSFSGGETSGLMSRLMQTEFRDRYDEFVFAFSNTGEENEQTLQFVRECDERWGLGVVWVEAVTHNGQRKSCTSRVVDFATASRNGEPFEAMIRKYGIPNKASPHCTRELKQRPLEHYLASIGWDKGTYDTAIGIRADEMSRCSPGALARRIVYPLVDWTPTTKPEVNAFWRDQAWRLQLCGYQGNCRWCWKKSLRKHMTLMDDDRSTFDFPERMEANYGLIGPEFLKEFRPGYQRTFFRQGMSAIGLRHLYSTTFTADRRAEDDAQIYEADDEPADGGCSESCEVDFEDDLFSWADSQDAA